MQAASSESLQTKAGAETDDKEEQGERRDRRVPWKGIGFVWNQIGIVFFTIF